MEKINFKDLPSTDTPIDSKNLNLLQANVENAINSVVESGNNYTKFNNGLLICYGNLSINMGTMTQKNPFWQYTNNSKFNFPVQFISKPQLNLTIIAGSYASILYSVDFDKSSINSIIGLTLSDASNQVTNANYIAIGRWK